MWATQKLKFYGWSSSFQPWKLDFTISLNTPLHEGATSVTALALSVSPKYIMKILERLLLAHLRPQVGQSQDLLQFCLAAPYRCRWCHCLSAPDRPNTSGVDSPLTTWLQATLCLASDLQHRGSPGNCAVPLPLCHLHLWLSVQGWVSDDTSIVGCGDNMWGQHVGKMSTGTWLTDLCVSVLKTTYSWIWLRRRKWWGSWGGTSHPALNNLSTSNNTVYILNFYFFLHLYTLNCYMSTGPVPEHFCCCDKLFSLQGLIKSLSLTPSNKHFQMCYHYLNEGRNVECCSCITTLSPKTFLWLSQNIWRIS